MKVETTTITKVRITGTPALDPIDVYLEDRGPSQGQITITCYGKSWAAYWGGMGGDTIAEFFCRCDEHYLAGKLSSTPSEVFDPEGLAAKARSEIIQRRRWTELSREDARRLYEAADQIDGIDDPRDAPENLMHEIFGDDWWLGLPSKPNPDYQYLCRIIKAVQSALRPEDRKVA